MVGDITDCIHGNSRQRPEATFVRIHLCRLAAAQCRCGMHTPWCTCSHIMPARASCNICTCAVCGSSPPHMAASLHVCRNEHPAHCRAADELGCDPDTDGWSPPGVEENCNPPFLVGRPLKGPNDGLCRPLVHSLPMLLVEDVSTTEASGWCIASRELLARMWADGNLRIQFFRQARLKSGDVMSSTVDKSQSQTHNEWGLVMYEDERGSPYFCVLEVEVYARVEASASGFKGFDPELCAQYVVPCPAHDVPHRPMTIALGKLWLATACTSTHGALGCRESYDAVSGFPPDMVGVECMSQSGSLVQGSSRQVVATSKRSRFYGTVCVRLESLCAQVGPTVRLAGDPVQCFLVCNRKSGKT